MSLPLLVDTVDTAPVLGKKDDEVGQRYGMLEVVGYVSGPDGATGEHFECKCDCGRIAVIRARQVRYGNNKSCGCKRPTYSDEQARAVMIRAGVDPLVPYQNNKTPWRSRCMTCQRTVTPQFANVAKGQGACWFCADTKLDIESVDKILGQKGLVRVGPYVNARVNLVCRCATCATPVVGPFANLSRRRSGCRHVRPNVEQQRILVRARIAELGVPEKFYRYDEATAVAILEFCGFSATESYPGLTGQPWPSRCMTCRRPARPRLSALIAGKGGCSNCGGNGFNSGAPATVYLMRNHSLRAAKVGICARDGERIKQHKSRGWELVSQHDVEGHHAREVEDAVLVGLTNAGVPLAVLDRTSMKQGGWTETFPTRAIALAADLMKLHVEGLNDDESH